MIGLRTHHSIDCAPFLIQLLGDLLEQFLTSFCCGQLPNLEEADIPFRVYLMTRLKVTLRHSIGALKVGAHIAELE